MACAGITRVAGRGSPAPRPRSEKVGSPPPARRGSSEDPFRPNKQTHLNGLHSSFPPFSVSRIPRESLHFAPVPSSEIIKSDL
eukprot:scaffold202797_cov22-Tisochrysis_lutea.AAC.1